MFVVTWRRRNTTPRSCGWNYNDKKPYEHVKTYSTKKAIFDDIQIAWDKEYYPWTIECGCTVAYVNPAWVVGPNFIGSVYKKLKTTFDGKWNWTALPQPSMEKYECLF